ncbi:1-aminocyclopropane-1-carboxylate deaminase/D-cysteine desulfhydrase [Tunicatimonas pelagia]|uniref:1-aminocyclopropane-1-carboxylate deaminase/D-cysteine desulfhydrase n=1 Tax=Tunicatimonas pelagia TaxID=931531 RepID=UPI002665671B|nr:pyridoxal-phosphate dependent enzyme [Tunicatimonas pelagia]WKN41565.1 pyridoxal-phosphate dependent enzyme [Tunicatimonas pelagia]
MRNASPIIQQLDNARLNQARVAVSVLRLDKMYPDLSGNKWYKLKYNLQQARAEGKSTLLTFGGAYSNHIYATAAAGKLYDFDTIGIIRGERPKTLNPTLRFAEAYGMQLHFVSREAYRNKESDLFTEQLQQKFGSFYRLPEGGTNGLAIKGCSEILPTPLEYDFICSSVGTGGTLAGLLVQLAGQKQVLGFPALKGGNFLYDEINQLTTNFNNQSYTNYQLVTDYHFGGYAKANAELITFINHFYQKHPIPLDPVYNGKLFYGLYDLIQQQYFREGTRLLVIHTGGLQGITGFNERYPNKKLCILEG